MGLFSSRKNKNKSPLEEKSNSQPEVAPAVSKPSQQQTQNSPGNTNSEVDAASPAVSHNQLLDYIDITSPKILYDQLMLTDVREEFQPKSPDYCFIVESNISEEGHLSDQAIQKINAIAEENAKNCEEARWLLVFTKHPSSEKLATLVCLPDYHEAQAVAHNTRGMRYPDAVIQFIENQVDSISHTLNANNMMSRPRVTTFFEAGIGGFSGAASSCLTHNLSNALPIMSAAWDKQLSLQNTNAAAPSAGPGLGTGGSSGSDNSAGSVDD